MPSPVPAPWTEHVPLDLVNEVVDALLRTKQRDDLLLANRVNTPLGASARRRATKEA